MCNSVSDFVMFLPAGMYIQSPGLSVAYVHGTRDTFGNFIKSILFGSISENAEPEYCF